MPTFSESTSSGSEHTFAWLGNFSLSIDEESNYSLTIEKESSCDSDYLWKIVKASAAPLKVITIRRRSHRDPAKMFIGIDKS